MKFQYDFNWLLFFFSFVVVMNLYRFVTDVHYLNGIESSSDILSLISFVFAPIIILYFALAKFRWKKALEVDNGQLLIVTTYWRHSVPLKTITHFTLGITIFSQDQVSVYTKHKHYKILTASLAGGTKSCKAYLRGLGIPQK